MRPTLRNNSCEVVDLVNNLCFVANYQILAW